jgi:hypothetical protein
VRADHRDGNGPEASRDELVVRAIVLIDIERRERHAGS